MWAEREGEVAGGADAQAVGVGEGGGEVDAVVGGAGGGGGEEGAEEEALRGEEVGVRAGADLRGGPVDFVDGGVGGGECFAEVLAEKRC